MSIVIRELSVEFITGKNYLTVVNDVGQRIPFLLSKIESPRFGNTCLYIKYGNEERDFSHDGNDCSYKVVSINGEVPTDLNHLAELIINLLP